MAVHPHEQMRDEMARYGTFSYYKSVVPKGLWFTRMAAAGFYLSSSETVRCAFCGTETDVKTFESRDPLELHRERSPKCPFVLNHCTGNRTAEQVGQASSMRMLHVLLHGEGQSKEKHPSSPTVRETSGRDTYLPEGSTVPQSARPVEETTLTASSLPAHGNAVDGLSWSSWSDNQQGSSVGSEHSGTQARTEHGSQSGGQRSQSGGPSSGSFVPASHVSATRKTETNRDTTEGRAEGSRQVVTYQQLGIFTEKPKRPDLAVTATRMSTFAQWPLKETHPPEEMAEAGFYYTGHGDLARCFFCKGGLKSWDCDLRPWVQHAQWFPKCAFVLQAQGTEFVAAVQALKDQVDVVSPEDVKREMIHQRLGKTQGNSTVPRRNWHQTASIQETTTAATATAPPPGPPAAAAYTREDSAESDLDSQEQDVDRLEEENREMTCSRFCKICLSEEATILFLPCGHLVACVQCAPALRACAICRQKVGGTVRIKTDCD